MSDKQKQENLNTRIMVTGYIEIESEAYPRLVLWCGGDSDSAFNFAARVMNHQCKEADFALVTEIDDGSLIVGFR